MDDRPRLSRDVVASLSRGERRVELPPARAIASFPERVVQFGTGAFLRGFVDYFIDEANRARVVRRIDRRRLLHRQPARRGAQSSRTACSRSSPRASSGARRASSRIASSPRSAARSRRTTSGTRCSRWRAIRTFASSSPTRPKSASRSTSRTVRSRVRRVVSRQADALSRSSARARFDYEPSTGLDRAAVRVDRRQRRRAARDRRAAGAPLAAWRAVREVARRRRDVLQHARRSHRAGRRRRGRGDERDGSRSAIATGCSPPARPTRSSPSKATTRCATGSASRAPIRASSSRPTFGPYRERKVRVLNGGHTITVSVALLAGLETVRDAVADERVGPFHAPRDFRRDRAEPRRAGCGAVRARSDRPVRQSVHSTRALDITLHGTAKMRVRVVPSIVGIARGPAAADVARVWLRGVSRVHARRSAGRAARGGTARAGRRRRRARRRAWQPSIGARTQASSISRSRLCARRALCGAPICPTFPDLSTPSTDHLLRIVRQGVDAALDAHLTETANDMTQRIRDRRRRGAAAPARARASFP